MEPIEPSLPQITILGKDPLASTSWLIPSLPQDLLQYIVALADRQLSGTVRRMKRTEHGVPTHDMTRAVKVTKVK